MTMRRTVLRFFLLTVLLTVVGMSATLSAYAAQRTCCCNEFLGKENCGFIDLSVPNMCADVFPGGYQGTVNAQGQCSAAPFSSTDAPKSTDVQVQFKPQVTIPTPGKEFEKGVAVSVTGRTLGEYISAIYVFFSGIVGVLAAVMLMWGGFRWMTAAGNESRVESAKETMYSSVIAVILILTAYILLNTINPELVKIRDLSSIITPISPIFQDSEFYQSAPKYSEALKNDPKATGTKNQYNSASCPTAEEINSGFTVFLTGYYMPEVSEYAGDAHRFQCAAGLNCDCPKDKIEPTATCSNSQEETWKACQWTEADIAAKKYCDHTRSNIAPKGLLSSSSGPYTAAGGQCFGKGTEFVLEPLDGSKNASSKVYTPTTWSVQDEGGDIKQRHLDLFMGYGKPARQAAFGLKNLARIKITKLCTSSAVKGVKNSKAPEATPTCETIP